MSPKDQSGRRTEHATAAANGSPPFRDAGGTAGVRVRRARPEEAGGLTELALRSKAYWGYDDAFLEACRRGELGVSPAFLATHEAYVLEDARRVVGFYALQGEPPDADLAFMFIEPSEVRRGYGRRLWVHAVATARQLGYRRLLVESDPNAEPFYRAMGASRVGEVPSTVWPGRMLPLLAVPLATGGA